MVNVLSMKQHIIWLFVVRHQQTYIHRFRLACMNKGNHGSCMTHPHDLPALTVILDSGSIFLVALFDIILNDRVFGNV